MTAVPAPLVPVTGPVGRFLRAQARTARLAEIDRLEGVKRELLQECYDLLGGVGGFAAGYARPPDFDGPDGYAGPGSFGPLLGYSRQGRKDGGNWPLIRSETDLDLMRASARWLADTNPYAIGFLGHLTHFVIGKGFRWEVVLRGSETGAVDTGVADRDGDGRPDADPDVAAGQRLLDDWRAAEHWGPANAQPDPAAHPDDPVRVRGNRETESFRRAVTEGEANARLFPQGWRQPPTLRLVEPELIGSPDGDTTGPASWGKATAPGDAETLTAVFVRRDFGGLDGEWVPARRLVTHKRNVVASVKRGVTDFLPVGEQLQLVAKLNRNMGTVACIVAAIAYIRQHPVGTTELQVTQMIDRDTDYQTVRAAVGRLAPGRETLTPTKVSVPGEVVDVNNGQQWVPPPLVAGVPGFIQAQQAMLRGIGTRWCAPEYFSGDSSNANFASTLVSGSPFVKAVEAAQEEWAGFEAELACRVLEFAAASGCISRSALARIEVKITPPAVALANKAEDTQRREVLCRNKVLSPQTWAVLEELDPRQEFANLKAFQQEFPDPMGGPTAGLFGDDPGGGNQFDGGPNGPAPLPEGGVTEAEYARLSEAGRAGLTKKVITNRLGHKQVVYVRPQQAPGGSGAKGADHDAGKAAESAVAAAVADPTRLHQGHLDELAGHLEYLSADQLKGLARQLEQKVGGKKAELADRILAHVTARRDQAKAADDAETAKSAPGAVRTVAPDALRVDPGRFQFKLHTDNPAGVTDELKAVTTWNPDFAGVIAVWKDPADGQTYVVNGHHRHELATRLGVGQLAVRYVAAADAQEARAKGALINIAEGRGTAVDAAKFMRDRGVTADDFAAHGVSLRDGAMAAQATALAGLSDKAFAALAAGDLDPGKAAAVGRHLSDHARQDKLFGLLQKREDEGKDLSTRTVEELARAMAAAPAVTRTDQTLWGPEEYTDDTFVQRADLTGHVRADLARDAGDFGVLASRRRADKTAGAGNVLNVDKNRELADAAEQAKRLFDTLANRKGPISDALNAGAVKLAGAKTEKERKRVRAETADAVRSAIAAQLGRPGG